MGGSKMKNGDVLVLTPKTRLGGAALNQLGNIVKVKYIQSGKFCVEHWNQGWRWIYNQNDKDFDWQYKSVRDEFLDQTEELETKRAIGYPTDLLGNNIETSKERVERWEFELTEN